MADSKVCVRDEVVLDHHLKDDVEDLVCLPVPSSHQLVHPSLGVLLRDVEEVHLPLGERFLLVHIAPTRKAHDLSIAGPVEVSLFLYPESHPGTSSSSTMRKQK